MSWFDKRKWSRHRAEEERKALAASIEELTANEKAHVDEWEEEEDGAELLSGPALIPPKLRLQSRPLPVVRLDVTRRGQVKQATEPQGRVPGPGTEAGEAPPAGEPGKRLGRSTKVRLQAVRPGQERITERVPVIERAEEPERSAVSERSEAARGAAIAGDGQVLVRRLEPFVAAASAASPSALVCGSGVIEEGQGDATIHNARISAQSVVSVMLAGDPGPVVVHYVSLQPRAGFTLHMSAPVSSTTPFTYAVWLF